MNHKEQQAQFTHDIAELIHFSHANGFKIALIEWGDLCARLVLINSEGFYDSSPEAMRFLCEYWKLLDSHNRSGIDDRDPKPDYFERIKK